MSCGVFYSRFFSIKTFMNLMHACSHKRAAQNVLAARFPRFSDDCADLLIKQCYKFISKSVCQRRHGIRNAGERRVDDHNGPSCSVPLHTLRRLSFGINKSTSI